MRAQLGLLRLFATVALLFPVRAADPIPIAMWPGYTRGPANQIVVRNNLAYVACRAGGLQILDVSDLKDIRRVGGYALTEPEWAEHLALAGNYVVVASTGPTIRIIDVSHPTLPRLISSFIPNQNGINTGIAAGVNYIYITQRYGYDRFQVWDISEPTQPTLAGAKDIGDSSIVALDNGFAFVATDSGVDIIDVRTPATPEVAGYIYAQHCSAVAVAGNFAYSTSYIYDGTGPSKLIVADITDRYHPTNIASVNVTNVPTGIVVLGSSVGVTDRNGAMEIFDVSDPANPVRAGYYYMAPVGHTVSGGFETSQPLLVGTNLFIAANDAGVAVLNVTEPTQPKPVGKYETSGQTVSVAFQGNTAFVADAAAGLEILDVQNPAAPLQLAQWLGDGGTNAINAIYLAGSQAFLSDGAGSLKIVDITSLTQPTLIRSVDLGGAPFDVTVFGGYAFIANFKLGLQIVDVRDIANATKVGEIASSGYAWAIEASDGFAYVATYGSNPDTKALEVFDVRDPANPKLAAGIPGLNMYPDLARIGSTLFYSDEQGIKVIDISMPQSPAPSLLITNTTTYTTLGGNLYTIEGLTPMTFNIYDARNSGAVARRWSGVVPLLRSINGIGAGLNRAAIALGNKGVAVFAIPSFDVTLEPIVAATDDGLKIRVAGPAGVTGHLQKSTSLDVWNDWQTVTFTADPIEISDVNNAAPHFYRFVSP